MLVLLLIILFHFAFSNYPKYFCITGNNTQVYLKPNEVTYMETKNFPDLEAFLGYDPFFPETCVMTFNIDPSSTNKTVLILVTNPIRLDSFSIIYDKVTVNWDNYEIIPESERNDIPFQGIVIHYELNENECFLDSISKPYHFYDASQILYIRSSIIKVNKRNHSCNWNFTAPDGYGFKIVIYELDLMSDTILLVTNSTNFYIFNHHSAVNEKSYYNEDNNLFIFLSNSNQSFQQRIEFGAYISIVQRYYKKVDARCTIDVKDDQYIRWTNLNPLNPHGYANNAYCSFELQIIPNTFVTASRTEFYNSFEIFDTVTYFDEYSNTFQNFAPSVYGGKAFFSYKNDTVRKILWEFNSDGSVRNLGFEMEFFVTYCVCNTELWIVPCEEIQYYDITNSTSSYYCSNMKCNFTITIDPKCSGSYFLVEVEVTNPSRANDTFKVISDDTVVFYINASNLNSAPSQTILNSNVTNIFEATTGEMNSFFPSGAWVTLELHDEVKVTKVIYLTKEKPYFVLDTSYFTKNNSFGIEIDDVEEFKNSYIEIYSNQFANGLTLYKDKALFSILQLDKCFYKFSYYCKTNVKKLYAWVDYNFVGLFLLFRVAPKELVGNCLLNSNIFISNDDTGIEKTIYSATANPNGSCVAYFLKGEISYFELNNTRVLTSVWTTASKDTVKVYTGYESKVLLFEFNKDTAEAWQMMVLYSPFYIIEIPANSSIVFKTKQIPRVSKNDIQPFEYSTVIHTPYIYYINYNYPDYRNESCFANFRIDEDIFVTFYVTYYNVSSFMEFQFFVDNDLKM